jgi:hypothetical protein
VWHDAWRSSEQSFICSHNAGMIAEEPMRRCFTMANSQHQSASAVEAEQLGSLDMNTHSHNYATLHELQHISGFIFVTLFLLHWIQKNIMTSI